MMSTDERAQMNSLSNDYRHQSRSLYDIERRLTLALILGVGSLLGTIGLTIYLVFKEIGGN